MIDVSNLSVKDKIIRAKIHLAKRSPFFGYILFHMKIHDSVEGMPEDNQTMSIDQLGNLRYSEKWVKGLSDDELMGVLAHETLHLALMHMERGQGREHRIANIAYDLVVNDVLTQENFRLPGDGLIPQNHKFEFKFGKKSYTLDKINDKSSEEVYDEIYPLYPIIKQLMMGNGSGKTGKGLDGLDGIPSENQNEMKKKLKGFDNHTQSEDNGNGDKKQEGSNAHKRAMSNKQKWKKIISEAAQTAKQQGKLPAGLERRIEGILDSKINWKEKLYKYIVAQLPFDYTWNKSSKRGAALGIYLPNVVKESVKIVCSIDTSGSINNDELKEFMSELLSIGESFQNLDIDLIICDCEIHETYELSGDTVEDVLNLKMSGGGGTSHLPVYDYVQKEIRDCKVLINFTDGWTSFPKDDEEIPFDSLWIICKNGCAEKHIPFGEVIKLSE